MGLSCFKSWKHDSTGHKGKENTLKPSTCHLLMPSSLWLCPCGKMLTQGVWSPLGLTERLAVLHLESGVPRKVYGCSTLCVLYCTCLVLESKFGNVYVCAGNRDVLASPGSYFFLSNSAGQGDEWLKSLNKGVWIPFTGTHWDQRTFYFLI